ncbi:hypothetical protein EVA_18627 [gut metagenome]|uniref:Uncharacterized protein n=1 Tax=gut metagenome TaxID=749906 RepID=J9FFQ4_9ZZZZ
MLLGSKVRRIGRSLKHFAGILCGNLLSKEVKGRR